MTGSTLATTEMCQLSTPLLTIGTRQYEVVRSVPAAFAALPVLQTAVEGLLALASGVDIDVIAAVVRAGVERHDRLVRGIDLRLEAEIAITDDDALRALFAHAHDQILPDGQAVIRQSAAQKAGEAQMRARRVTTESLTALGTLVRRSGGTMADAYAELQSTAASVGEADAERRQVAVEQSGPRAREARKRWNQAINLLEMALDAAGAESGQALGAIRAAQAQGGNPQPELPETPAPVVAPTPVVTVVTPAPVPAPSPSPFLPA